MTDRSAQPGHGPLVRTLDRLALFFQHVCEPQRRDRWRDVMRTSHPERTADEPSSEPVRAESVAESLWSELSRSDLHPDKWQFLGTQLDTAAPLLARLHAAIAGGELCVPCLEIFTGIPILEYQPSAQAVKLWHVHEEQDRWETRLANNGKAGAVSDYADTVLFCLTHKDRPFTRFYDSSGNPQYRDGYAVIGAVA